MAAVDLGGMEPQIVLTGHFKSQLIILPVISAHIDREAIGRFKTHGRRFCLLYPFFAGFRFDITACGKLLPDLLQLLLRRRPVQLLQHTLQVRKFFPANGDLLGQLFFCILHTGVIFIEFRRILLGRQDRGNGNVDDAHFLIVKILCLQHRLPLGDAVDIGGDDIAQLPQPLPAVGSGQFLFLNGQLLR